MSPLQNFLRETKDYQKLILEHLRDENGYRIRNAKTDYNQAFAIDPDLLFEFFNATQKDTIDKLTKLYKENTKQRILNYLNNEIQKKSRSRLDVLLHGIEFDSTHRLELYYPKPATSYNPKATKLYQQNIFSVMEEVYHKAGERIDLVLFLNGIAIITVELKCNTSGQSYEDAINQYRMERDNKTQLLKHKTGAFVHFAMDLNEAYMCTNLKKRASTFLPFNQGSEDFGKGNPHN